MTVLKRIVLNCFVLIPTFAFGTTWDEPWQDRVIKEADFFVFAKVNSFDSDWVEIEIVKSLGGEKLTGNIKITNFYLLDLCSRSGGHGPEFNFKGIKECYFFLKKNNKNEYCISTPTSGFAYLKDGKVAGAYRHSYHQALVHADVYEKTMQAIFNNYHDQPYDKQFMQEYVSKYLSLKPASFEKSEIETFFAQHVALETVYHLRLPDMYFKIIPFLADTTNFHNQVSGARAMIAYNTPACKQELLKIIGDSTRDRFLQVICVWTLAAFQPKELKEHFVRMSNTASNEESGFGGNIMDPRVCTRFPDVKQAIEDLISTL